MTNIDSKTAINVINPNLNTFIPKISYKRLPAKVYKKSSKAQNDT